VLVSADWSQLDLRILAHFSGDARLVSAFLEGADVHARTAAQIFDVAPADVTTEQRRVGKTVNYATIYGQGATALAQLLGMTRPEAAELIERYFAIYDGVKRWRDRTIADAHVHGGVRTLLGRRRLVAELSSRDPMERAHGERMALNNTIQGTAADLCKLAMLAIDREICRRGLRAAMLMVIHDELVLEAAPEELDEVRALVRDAMERPWPLDVPLVVDLGHEKGGRTWADAHA
jgi:DNA polymerase-1